jgi:hypothetical protein
MIGFTVFFATTRRSCRSYDIYDSLQLCSSFAGFVRFKLFDPVDGQQRTHVVLVGHAGDFFKDPFQRGVGPWIVDFSSVMLFC